MAADQDEFIVVLMKPLGIGLAKYLAGRGEVDGMDPFPLQVAQMLPALVQGICLHHRPMPAAVGVVVHLLLLVEGVVPDLVAVDADDVPFLGPAQDGLAQHVSYYIRKQRHDVNVVEKVHPFTSLRSGEPGGSPRQDWSLR